jgi:hypothetical protein
VDESSFTKGSAQQRKAEKDKMLESSPDAPKPTIAIYVSPYFGQGTNKHDPDTNEHSQLKHTDVIPDSPDALQGGETRPQQEFKGKSYPNMKVRDLATLVVGSDSSTTITKTMEPRSKTTSKRIENFELEKLFYPPRGDISGGIIEVDKLEKIFSVHHFDPLLSNEPLMDPRSLRQATVLEYGSDTGGLVSLEFSRHGYGRDKMFLKFKSEHAAYLFATLIGDLNVGVRITGREE